ncbi:helix-turn-helix domain-containing protein [Eggerthella sinensis]|jgi:putative transcriptional regulator|uniref:Transcriptional regulator n=1 Tax=Eggerthella sinensis TaxID=242230 RepID=A0A3N0J0K3_9ACTN|nr:helix-turn-helix domain-containing protein [Eggerthella sinensis]RDB69867.1 transcriptional regulator [Eggerthella sinensis]RNM42771.1 transcriptional regulator [Eggerthella sinensis]
MPIVLNLTQVMKERGRSVNDVAEKIGIAVSNLSKIRTGKVKAIRFSTLAALCKELNCKPGDIIDYIDDDEMDGIELIDDDFNYSE